MKPLNVRSDPMFPCSYVKALNVRFGTELHYDPMFELKNLIQLGIVQIYLDKFDQLLNRVTLSEEYIVSFFPKQAPG